MADEASKAARERAREKARRAREKARQKAKKLKGEGVGFLTGFFNFVREQGVVGLAVGLAIGTAAGASVKVIVDNLISPLVALTTRGVDLNDLQWVILEASGDKPEVAIGYGAIASSLITLIATAFVIYWLVHVAKLDRMDKKKE